MLARVTRYYLCVCAAQHLTRNQEFSRPPGCLAKFGAFTSTGSFSKWVSKPKSFCVSAENDPGSLTVNIQVFSYIISENILFGRKLCMRITDGCHTISAVVKQIFPPTIQKHSNKYNKVWVGILVALETNAGRALVMPAVQQPAEWHSTATVNGLVLPNCGVTRAQGHSRVPSPPLMATRR